MDSIVLSLNIFNDKKYTKKLLRIPCYISKRVILFNYCTCEKFLACLM